MTRSLLALFLVSLFVAHSADASVFQLPKTGQTTCWDSHRNNVSCAGTGQDGDLQLGLAWPDPRFVDNGDETVTDNLTGLMWTKNANLMKSRDPQFDADSTANDGWVIWQHALDYVKKLNNEGYLGYSDWRLPNVNELERLVNYGQSTPATLLNSQGVYNVQPHGYWSSSSYSKSADNAWNVDMFLGGTSYANKNSSYNCVWPVRDGLSGPSNYLTVARSGQTACYDAQGSVISCSGTGQDGELQSGAAWPTLRFSDNGDSTLTDNLTGLVWSKDGNTAGPIICTPGVQKSWQSALDYVKCLNTSHWLRRTDWRLPNANELLSLVHYGQAISATWLNSQGFSNIKNFSYWSSSSYAYDTEFAWVVGMDSGYLLNVGKAAYVYVLPVSSSQTGTWTSASLSITTSGNGSGTISSSPAGISCGSTCSASFTSGQSVTLTAAADSGSTFASWTGCDSSSGNQCTIAVTGVKSVSASFDLIPAACGSANGVASSTAPATNLCAGGTASVVTSTATSWNWTCSTGSGSPATCSAGIPEAQATIFQLPKSGQTVSYAAGDDGDLKVGLAWPGPRFVDNGDQTVTDKLTGLIWSKDANLMKSRDAAISATGAVTWQGALDYVKKLNTDNYQGHSDWRLANILELASLLHRGEADQVAWLTGQGFTNVQGSKYWSSNGLDGLVLATSARDLNLQYGRLDQDTKSSSFFVWAVRTGPVPADPATVAKTGPYFCYDGNGRSVDCAGTGQDSELQSGAPWPNPRFIDNRDRTLTDNLTGLTWSQRGNTPGPASCAPGTAKSWQGALDYVKCLNTSAWLGKTDWRLPNLSELQSLVYYGRHNTTDWLKGHGFTDVGINFWSSTTDPTNTGRALGMTDAGGTTFVDKTTSVDYIYVWPVRGGANGSAASLSVAAAGGGRVASSSGSIDCGSTCSANFASGQIVTLTAFPASGSTLASWTGCDSVSANQCTVVVRGTTNVTASFDVTDCGSANGSISGTTPAANLCVAGTASAVTATTTSWHWSCTGGGTPSFCSASKPAGSFSVTTVQLPQSGQTLCYDTSGAIGAGGEIACAGTGQDGDKLTGKPWPYPRFTDNRNGSVTDSLTGLVWLKNAACLPLWGGWQEALDKAKALKGDGSQCGLNDGSSAGQWRLPNKNEMLSLLDRQRRDPALAIGHPFLGFNSYGYDGRYLWYWTSTYFQAAPSFAYIVNLYDGELTREDKTRFSTYVWPVRDGGQTGTIQLPRTGQKDCRPAYGDGGTTPCTGTGQDGELQKGAVWPDPRLVDNGNGTVTDRLTGLIWLKNGFCTDTVNGIATSADGYLNWANALAWSSNLATGSCGLADGSAAGDWRLPNITELESLIDVSQTYPAYPLNHPFTIPNGGGYYWSSTTTAGDGTIVWGMSSSDGFISTDNGSYMFGKGGSLFMRTWPVRGGISGNAVSSSIPATADMGTVAVGGNASQIITIANQGVTSRLQVSSMDISGTDAGDFSLNPGDGTNGTCGTKSPIIAAGSSCTISVKFNPTSSGNKTANLRISSSDAATPDRDIPLSGSAQLNGACGSASGGTFNTAPANNLCAAGTASALSGTGPWSWTCAGGGGGSDASCSAAIRAFTLSFTAGSHGSLTGTTSQAINYGGSATTVTAAADPTYAFVNWTEGTTVVGTNPVLTVGNVTANHSYTANFSVNYGICGTSNGATLTAAPRNNLCSAGTPTFPSGTGPWVWKCANSLGGPDANCSANIESHTVTPTGGVLVMVSPATPQAVNYRGSTSFAIGTAAGYGVAAAGCGGTMTGNTFTTGAITGDCSVSFTAVARNADSSGSGQPTLVDAMKALDAYRGKLQLSATDKIRYDVAPLGNDGLPVGNGVVDAADVVLILRRTVGLGKW